ncbi:hypothetical protein O181_023132 [Austropuccinia psidii MF-1]|uniref:Tyrosinase copper-binding domain-containing protein n=1 Tax=Austropuccinia psidii MF-1 TaxID=1389203 RepID=A0A9Q3GXS1_9BASI|nr:hypothetical protein [Austropuccinia psidii MF-1]
MAKVFPSVYLLCTLWLIIGSLDTIEARRHSKSLSSRQSTSNPGWWNSWMNLLNNMWGNNPGSWPSNPSPPSNPGRPSPPSNPTPTTTPVRPPPVTTTSVPVTIPTSPPTGPTGPNSTQPGQTLPNTCSQKLVRREWRTLDRNTQRAYIQSVKCLVSKPSKLFPNSQRQLYDDFVYVHDQMRLKVHWVASFLVWHRHFIHLYEQALQDCGYTGGLPRWDWTLDAANMSTAPVWSPDPQVGFGGNGVASQAGDASLAGGKVIDGAFANFQLRYPDQHFLERGFNSPAQFNQGGTIYGSQYFDDKAIAVVHSSTNFLNFHVALEGTNPESPGPDLPGPHGTIHTVIGGDMSPTSYAPNDVSWIFFLHHSNIDYHWTTWQNADLANRLRDFSGNRVEGSSRNNAQLTDKLSFLGIGADPTVSQVMDSSVYPYCYTYASA